MILGNVLGSVRFSNYLPEEEVGEIIMRLRQYYDVSFAGATYYVNKQMFYFNFAEDNSAIVRVFPLKDYYKLDPEGKMPTYEFGIIYINEEDKFQMQVISSAFFTILCSTLTLKYVASINIIEYTSSNGLFRHSFILGITLFVIDVTISGLICTPYSSFICSYISLFELPLAYILIIFCSMLDISLFPFSTITGSNSPFLSLGTFILKSPTLE